MAGDNNDAAGGSEKPGTNKDADKGGSENNESENKLSLEDARKAILEKSGLSEDDIKRVYDGERDVAVSSFKKKSSKDAKEASKKKVKEDVEKQAAEDMKKLEGADLAKAQYEEKTRQLDVREAEVLQGRCQAHLIAAGLKDMPEGVTFESEENAQEFVSWFEKIKPTKSEENPAPGRPDASSSLPKPKSEAEEIATSSDKTLDKLFPWRKKIA